MEAGEKGAYRARVLMQLGDKPVEQEHFVLLKRDGVTPMPEKQSRRWARK